MMDKEFALDIIKLLSALESWSFSVKAPVPDYLHEHLVGVVDRLSQVVVK